MRRDAPLPTLGHALLALSLLSPLAALAHFQELIPSTDILTEESGKGVDLDLTFTHPMERGPVMDMGLPVRFGVLGPKGPEDLLSRLKPKTLDGKLAFKASYQVKQPGDYVFFVEPAPYWEPAEGVMIVHYTKVVVDAFGAEEGWDAEIGLPVEIAPLARPYGLWTGNQFRGIVKQNGKPVPFAEVEVEWRNDGSLKAPADPFITQVVKADTNGVFSYVMPRAGWWGFAALLEGDKPMKNPAGDEVPVEAGALMWVRVQDMQ
jgi:cobalt/nickel transport protein